MTDIPDTDHENFGWQGQAMTDAPVDMHAWFLREVLPLEAALTQFLKHHSHGKTSIADLLQEIYVRVYQSAKVSMPNSTKSFVFTTAHNLLVDRVRREKVIPIEAVENLEALGVAAESPGPEAENLITATGARIVEGSGNAYYHRGDDLIRLPSRETFVSTSDFYCTTLHELGHWTAHPSRLGRDLQNRFGSEAYAREELIAELTSAFLCAHLGIVPQVRHTDYIANWLQILKSDPRAIFHAASQASKASDFILALRHPEPPSG